ncbi:GNAT family N-acetyltransferase [Enterococcus timonensis]|uniref:GNAT family N-acetyltransferase n=1 Tax=Enterococcus timonensis TaxID=1852364 RepID=UPI0008D9B82C|nr:GNAT family protein [Enterococcus timonensis]
MELTIREAVPNDGEKILAYLKEVSKETDFLVLDQLPAIAEYQELLDFIFNADNQTIFIALEGETMIGMGNINGATENKRQHIGELGVSVRKEYWQLGLGSIIVEELLAWVQEESSLMRIELYVSAENTAAIHLYEKFSFETEGRLRQALQKEDDTFADVLVMARLFA